VQRLSKRRDGRLPFILVATPLISHQPDKWSPELQYRSNCCNS
jgi:hypothetical protein